MAVTVEIPIRLILDQRKTRTVWQGSEVVVPTREEVQNDAETLLSVFGTIDVGQDEYAERERLVRRIKRALRPMVRKGEAFERPGEYDLGHLELNEDEAEFLLKILTSPPKLPDGRGGQVEMPIRGAMADTFGDLRDHIEDWKAEQRRAEREAEKAQAAPQEQEA